MRLDRTLLLAPEAGEGAVFALEHDVAPGRIAPELARAAGRLEGWAPPAVPALRPASDAEELVPVEPHVMAFPAYLRAGLGGPRILTLRKGVVERLSAASEELPDRFSLVVLDGYRPRALQARLFEEAFRDYGPDAAGFVADPMSDAPPHLTGGAFDITLAFDRVPLGLGTGFDEFTRAAHADAFERARGPVRELRRLLASTLAAYGFEQLWCEWWHFSCTQRAYTPVERQPG